MAFSDLFRPIIHRIRASVPAPRPAAKVAFVDTGDTSTLFGRVAPNRIKGRIVRNRPSGK